MHLCNGLIKFLVIFGFNKFLRLKFFFTTTIFFTTKIPYENKDNVRIWNYRQRLQNDCAGFTDRFQYIAETDIPTIESILSIFIYIKCKQSKLNWCYFQCSHLFSRNYLFNWLSLFNKFTFWSLYIYFLVQIFQYTFKW